MRAVLQKKNNFETFRWNVIVIMRPQLRPEIFAKYPNAQNGSRGANASQDFGAKQNL